MKKPHQPTYEPARARIVEGHACEFCGKPMHAINSERMYCKDVGQNCEAKNRVFKIGYKGL
jgi:hypothetical protein